MTALLSRNTIAKQFMVELSSDLLARLRAVQIAGARHGRAGYYPDVEFGSDADWCAGIGAEIQALEEILDIDDGAVFSLYADAHSAFYRDGTINPNEREDYSPSSVFTFRFGAYGNTYVSVWAPVDHVEDALELAAEWLADHVPGLFVGQDALDDLMAEVCTERGLAWPAPAGTMHFEPYWAAKELAYADLTHTESGYLASWEWSVSESATPPGPPRGH